MRSRKPIRLLDQSLDPPHPSLDLPCPGGSASQVQVLPAALSRHQPLPLPLGPFLFPKSSPDPRSFLVWWKVHKQSGKIKILLEVRKKQQSACCSQEIPTLGFS